MKEKLRSWALWVSMAALVVFCVKEFGGVDISASVNELQLNGISFFVALSIRDAGLIEFHIVLIHIIGKELRGGPGSALEI